MNGIAWPPRTFGRAWPPNPYEHASGNSVQYANYHSGLESHDNFEEEDESWARGYFEGSSSHNISWPSPYLPSYPRGSTFMPSAPGALPTKHRTLSRREREEIERKRKKRERRRNEEEQAVERKLEKREQRRNEKVWAIDRKLWELEQRRNEREQRRNEKVWAIERKIEELEYRRNEEWAIQE